MNLHAFNELYRQTVSSIEQEYNIIMLLYQSVGPANTKICKL